MKQTFLTAYWRNLLLANYEVNPAVLKPYLPAGTELDTYEGKHFVSLVGFMFQNTRVKGIRFPFHQHFEEVNLRFYVRYFNGEEWKRGAVFIKEFVPKPFITLTANILFKENYSTLKMRHMWDESPADKIQVSYEWKSKKKWNHLRADAYKVGKLASGGSMEEFITEHYWGYTKISGQRTSEYEVLHPQWKIHQVTAHDIEMNGAELYGQAFAESLSQPPQSIFLAAGSVVEVRHSSMLMY